MSLLGNPGMSIERITEEVGYRDIRSFRRAFKRWTGVSPATFRSEGTSPLDGLHAGRATLMEEPPWRAGARRGGRISDACGC